MKINIGPYEGYFGVYQLAELFCYVGVSKDQSEKIGEYLSKTFVESLLNWIYSLRDRRVNIKLDKYDTVEAGTTMALVIHPILVQLKETKHGMPLVDDEDVPEYLQNVESDEIMLARWDYVLDEMIHSFAQLSSDDWETKFHSGTFEFIEKHDVKSDTFEIQKGPNDTHVFDSDGYHKELSRINTGLRLFAKYYWNLWD